MPDPERELRPWLPAWLPPVLIVLFGLSVYFNSFDGVFLFDDTDAIHRNPYAHSLTPWWKPFWAPRDTAVSGRPLVSFSIAVNYALNGLDPWGYHAFNLAIHLLAGLTLYGLVRRTFEIRHCPGRLPAMAIALLWVVHPLQTESVTYIVQRAESMVGLFYLLTLYCAVRSATSNHPRWWVVGAVASCAAGMGTKEVMVTAPLVVLLYDRTFLSQSFRAAFQQRWHLYAGLAATWLILAALMATGPRTKSTGLGLTSNSPLSYALTQPGVIAHYLRLVFWPRPLVLDYGWTPPQRLADVAPAAALLIALLAASLLAWRRRSPLGFLGLVFFLILAPSSSIIPIADRAFEHRMYLPLAAVMAAVVGTAFAAARTVGTSARVAHAGLGLVVLGIAGWLGTETWKRNNNYMSDFGMWADVVMKRPENPRGWNNLGHTLVQGGRPDEAVERFGEALRRWPDYPDANWNMSGALILLGRIDEAVEYGRRAVRLAPHEPAALNNLGAALGRLSQLDEALGYLNEACQREPDRPDFLLNLATVLNYKDRREEARKVAARALDLAPDAPEGHYTMARVLESSGDMQGAIREYTETLRRRPEHKKALTYLGVALVAVNRSDEARACFEKALALDETLWQAHANLGNILMLAGQDAEALPHLTRALELNPQDVQLRATQRELVARVRPDSAEAQYNAAAALHRVGRTAEALAAGRRAVALRPDWDLALNNLAWMLATNPDASLRNPTEAVQLAEKSNPAGAPARAESLDTLAAAYAAAGRFDDAMKAARRALDAARNSRSADLAREIEERLKLYESGRAYYREAASSQPVATQPSQSL